MTATRRTFATALFIAATCAPIASTADEYAHAAFIERTEGKICEGPRQARTGDESTRLPGDPYRVS